MGNHCNYKGLTIHEIDNLLEPYAEKTYKKLLDKYNNEEEALKELSEIMFKCFRRIQFKIKCVINAGGRFGCL